MSSLAPHSADLLLQSYQYCCFSLIQWNFKVFFSHRCNSFVSSCSNHCGWQHGFPVIFLSDILSELSGRVALQRIWSVSVLCFSCALLTTNFYHIFETFATLLQFSKKVYVGAYDCNCLSSNTKHLWKHFVFLSQKPFIQWCDALISCYQV